MAIIHQEGQETACFSAGTEYDFLVLFELDVKTLSKIDKLRLLESLWADLSADDVDILSPTWHQGALKETEELYAQGKARFADWDEAKARIRATVSSR